MVNISLASIALAASIGFYLILDEAVSNLPEPVKVDVWQCDGWNGVKYPTEKTMRGAFK